eukprot:m.104357 g.104357  ORF g.104357 m.104357 type:complete len:707 (-) comp9111_c2_seq4:84-2204(-)
MDNSPGMMIQGLRAQPVIGSTDVNVMWEKPEESQSSSIYKVMRREVGAEGAKWTTVMQEKDIFTAVVSRLKPFTRYEFRVQVLGIVTGLGPMSEPVVAMTNPAAPGDPPTNVRVSSVTTDSITITWDPPTHTHSPLTSYHLFFDQEEQDDYVEAILTANTFSYTALYLFPNTEYRFQIYASTAAGDGPHSELLICSTRPSVAIATSSSSPSSSNCRSGCSSLHSLQKLTTMGRGGRKKQHLEHEEGVDAPRVNPFKLPTLDPALFIASPHDFDRNLFTVRKDILSMVVPCNECNTVVKALNGLLLNAPKLSPVAKRKEGDDPTTRTILLSPLKDVEELKESICKALDKKVVELETYTVSVDYDYWSADEILKAGLPQEFNEVTTSFEAVGHLAHMNLRDHQLPYKHFIGQVILDKNKHLKTVVNKLSNIDTTYRFFQMELIAGEDNFMCETKENGCVFQFDFSKVYWNSRLHTEHKRIINVVADKKKSGLNAMLLDMMAGVGPFSLPLAKRGISSYANDLNPLSYEAMVKNIAVNKIKKRVKPFNMDARDFVKFVTQNVIEEAKSTLSASNRKFPMYTDVTMNLPASSITFLDVFIGLFKDDTDRLLPLPEIHCHCFTNHDDMENDVVARVEEAMKGKIDKPFSFRVVRNVSPHKHMVCISFILPKAVAYNTIKDTSGKRNSTENGNSEDDSSSSPPKKPFTTTTV